jgi:hypothetical protein
LSCALAVIINVAEMEIIRRKAIVRFIEILFKRVYSKLMFDRS